MWFQVVSNNFLCPNRTLLVIVENTTVYSMAINSSSSNISFTVGGLDTEEWLTTTAKIVDTNANTVFNESQINVCKSYSVYILYPMCMLWTKYRLGQCVDFPVETSDLHFA